MTPHHSRMRALGYAVLYVLLGALVVGVLTVIVRTGQVVDTMRDAQVESTARGKEIQSLTETINGCVDPDGACYKQGQRRTAGAVADINRVVILASACAVGVSPNLAVVDRQALIQSCVISRLARENAGSRRP